MVRGGFAKLGKTAGLDIQQVDLNWVSTHYSFGSSGEGLLMSLLVHLLEAFSLGQLQNFIAHCITATCLHEIIELFIF